MTNDLKATYGTDFFSVVGRGACDSAQVCAPLILQLLRPASVIDVGCGQGEWLALFRELGVGRILGVDGPHIEDGQLLIPSGCFRRSDLARPLRLAETFDLAMSLEVAEHLPSDRAESLVADLTRLAPAVLFSAAVPGQGGVHHVNEQWPWYWQELFGRRGFVCLDPIRPAIWHDGRVAGYYRQNLFLYVDPAVHTGLVDRLPRSEGKQQLTLVQSYILENLTRPPLLRRAASRLRAALGLGR